MATISRFPHDAEEDEKGLHLPLCAAARPWEQPGKKIGFLCSCSLSLSYYQRQIQTEKVVRVHMVPLLEGDLQRDFLDLAFPSIS